MQFGFAGSPPFAADILQILLDANVKPQLVFTQTSKPTGRGRRVQTTPVHTLALQEDLHVETPHKIIECAGLLQKLDLLAVAAYGQILPKNILSAPRYGCINVHSSILPRWRGASPIEHTILHGDHTAGVSIMHIEPELDAGAIYSQQSIPLSGDETSATLSKELARLGGIALLNVLKKFVKEEVPSSRPQPTTGITYAPRLSTEAARLNWKLSAMENERKVRAFVGRNAAFTTRGDLRLRVLKANVQKGLFAPGHLYRGDKELLIGCSPDGLVLQTIQLNRGKGTALSARAALNGYGRLLENGIRFE